MSPSQQRPTNLLNGPSSSSLSGKRPVSRTSMSNKSRPPLAGAIRRTTIEDVRPRSRSSTASSATPLPTKQLIVLAIIALAEQTAFNSISPYLPDMASTFPEVEDSEVGLYVGLIASAFALAQFVTNFFWGWLSDYIGRKPVILLGALLTSGCFVAFGFSRTLWQAITVQVLMGLVNGNQGVVPTCLGEITDRSNQSAAFTYLPVVYGIGTIVGPILGGLLVTSRDASQGFGISAYPYLPPNIMSGIVLFIEFIVAAIFLEESLEEAKNLPPLSERFGSLFSYIWQFTSSSRPSYINPGNLVNSNNNEDEPSDDEEEEEEDMDAESGLSLSGILPQNEHHLAMKDVLHRDVILILITYFIFQFAPIAYNSLYPIFAQARPPTGRNLTPKEIGVSLGFAGVVTIIFQVGIFGRLKGKIGNKSSYRIALALFVISFVLMPWIGYKDSNIKNPKVWLWIELGIVLIFKTIATVGGLTSAMLLITNSAPDHSVLGTLNGLAQTLSAAGRAVGPFISGSLFTAATHVQPKGEALAFGVFGGISFIGFLLSFGIRGAKLEAENDPESGSNSDDEDDSEDDDDEETQEAQQRRPLLNGSRKR